MNIIGHRGARGLAPENTLASLQAALHHHAQELEFDVRVTKDHIPVLHHDPDVQFGPDHFPIRLHRLAQLTKVKPDLLTLESAFAVLPPTAHLLIEIKPDEPVAPIIAVIRQALRSGWQPEQLYIASFSFAILRDVATALPEIGLVVNERWSGVRASYRARRLKTRRISMNQRWLWAGFIWSMHQRGYQLAAYTLNDPAKGKRWHKSGLAAVITDFPNYFER